MQKSLAYRIGKKYGQLPFLGKAAVIIFIALLLVMLIASAQITLLFPLSAGLIVWGLWKTFSPNTSPGSKFAKSTINTPRPYETFSKKEGKGRAYDRDNWEGSFWEVQQPFTGTATLRIDYEDGAGQKTNRVVDIRQYGTASYGNILIGHCRMRNETRTFRTDRIKRCVDQDTGEIISDVFAYLREKYERSPEHLRDTLLENEYDTLRVLLYIGKADGQLRAEEKAIIRTTCRSFVNDSRITDVMIDDLFYNLQVPTIQAFKLAVGRLAKNGTEAYAVLMKAAEDMVATQKTVHPSEIEALEYMRKRYPHIANIAS